MSVEPRAYVTYFDQRYLAFAIVMLRSLRRHDPQADVFALCLDQVAYDVVTGLGERGIIAVPVQALYDFDPALAACSHRVRSAFYATHKPVLPLYALRQRPDLAAIAHIDADMYAFASPAPLWEETAGASIAITPHRFSAQFEHYIGVGRFNAGFIAWRNDELGRRCLEDYRADCLQWCEPYNTPDGRSMNQGYLTFWPERYPGTHVVRHPGVNLAWWNLARHALAFEDGVTVDGEPLIFYHFSALFLDELGLWRTKREFGANLPLALQAVYAPYLTEVERTDRWLRRKVPGLLPMERVWAPPESLPVRRGPWPRSLRGLIARAKLLREPL